MYGRSFGPRIAGIMWPPRNSAFFLSFCASQRRRFSFTSRIPTVICVGRRSEIGVACKTGSRTYTMARIPPLISCRLGRRVAPAAVERALHCSAHREQHGEERQSDEQDLPVGGAAHHAEARGEPYARGRREPAYRVPALIVKDDTRTEKTD